jgi:ABC-type phosphate/phosphonate transport system ATPase subunit
VDFTLYRYNATLTRNNQNQYILSYKDVNDVVKELPPASLEALLATMRGTNGFEANDITTIRAQAALIPAARLSSSALDDIKIILTSFYTVPNSGTYTAVRDVYALYNNNYIKSDDKLFSVIRDSYENALKSFNVALAEKVYAEAHTSRIALSGTQQQRLLELRQR